MSIASRQGVLFRRVLLLWWMSLLPLVAQTFTDITASANIGFSGGLGHLSTWIDYNQDGWPDIFASTINQNALYRNNGDGTFTDVIQNSGLTQELPNAVAVADYDKDGYPDLLIASNHVNQPVKIFRNRDGSGVFDLVFSGQVGVVRAIWLDYNGDGYLDIFCHLPEGYPLLYRHNPDGTFTEVAGGMGFHPNSGSTSTAADIDRDGLPEIFCAVYTAGNRLYYNWAGADFIDISLAAHVLDFRRAVSSTWADYDRDGDLDLYVANIGATRNLLYANNGDRTFTDVTMTAGVADVGDGRTSSWVDVDNDGWMDLFTTNHVNPNRLYRNNHDGTFTDIASMANIASPQDGFDVSWSDFDNDGDVDVLIAGHFAGGVALLRNEGGNQKNYLKIKLQGVFDSADGIGAEVALYAGGHRQVQQLHGGNGARGQNGLRLHFGVDTLTVVDSLVVYWPGGTIQRVMNIPTNQLLTVSQSGNVPPGWFHLQSPPDQTALADSVIHFTWTPAIDPDSGRAIAYELHLSGTHHDTLIAAIGDTTFALHVAHWDREDTLTWYVRASDGHDFRRSWETWSLYFSPVMTIGDPPEPHIRRIALEQNYPNPFNPTTNFRFQIAEFGFVELRIYDLMGRAVRTLIQEKLPPGRYEVQWDGTDEAGNPVAGGVYLYRLKAGNRWRQTRKMVLIR
ncbi:MAG: T9SS C-terminal target domain-containing protein [Calditrichaeota bacterium]|nr:MAG: T9SS C-terminal target domain-containing protein [Calditrichota bacterium]